MICLFINLGELRDLERVASVPPGIGIPGTGDRPSDSMVEKFYRSRVFLNELRRAGPRRQRVRGALRPQAD